MAQGRRPVRQNVTFTEHEDQLLDALAAHEHRSRAGLLRYLMLREVERLGITVSADETDRSDREGAAVA